MHYIYHLVPNDLQGTILYPLNTLRDVYPDIYARQVSKYDGREHVTEQRIPLFDDCLWNDVLFFSPVNPVDIYQARREAGWPDVTRPNRFFKIDPRTLDQSRLGIFLFSPAANPKNYSPDEFAAYHYEDLETYAHIPQATKDYFAQEYKAGQPHIKLFWKHIPHIIYKGEINISNTEIITAS